MAVDYNNEYGRIAGRMTQLIKKTIDDLGLVDSGKLKNTARFEYIAERDGDAKFTLVAQDYFKYVDARYGIMKALYESSEYKKMVDDIARINADFIADEISKSL